MTRKAAARPLRTLHSSLVTAFSVQPLEVFPILRPLSKPAIVGILFAVFLLALIIYQTLGMNQYECEVCVEFNGRTKCLTVKGENELQAVQTAKDNACSYVVNGRAESFRCSQTPPASTRCKHL